MNYITFDPTILSGEKQEWWSRWCDKAENATIEAIQQADDGKKVIFRSDIWSELKRWLLSQTAHPAASCGACKALF